MASCHHTPGPWKYGEAKGYLIVWDQNGWGVAEVKVSRGEDAALANAKLIAAAPELLAALKHIVGGALSLPRFAEEEARAAITKATGES